MSGPQIIKVRCGNDVRNVALYAGIASTEIVDLIRATFGVYNNTIVGFLAEDGTAIPLSMAARSPEVMPTGIVSLIAINDEHAGLPAPPRRIGETVTTSTGTGSSAAVVPVHSTGTDARASSSSSPMHTSELNEESLDQLLRFMEGLRARGIINKVDCHLLKELLFEDPTLITAAYSVAVAANDPEYLAEICRDLAAAIRLPEGREACESQMELLNVCNYLYGLNKITENQLMYLRHLVLIRDEVIAEVFDRYISHGDITQVAKDLYAVAHTHPYQDNDDEDDNEDDDDEGMDLRSRDTDTTDPRGREVPIAPEFGSSGLSVSTGVSDAADSTAVSTPMMSTMQSLVVLMLRAKSINSEEALVLSQMIDSGSKYLVGAYELFEHDGDMDNLQDIMVRAVHIEMYKQQQGQVSSNARQKAAAPTQQRRGQQQQKQYDSDSSSGSDCDSDNSSTSTSDSDTSSGSSTSSSSEGNLPPRARVAPATASSGAATFQFEEKHLNGLLSSLNVKNVWSASGVPAKFIAAVFYAAKNKMFSIGQAKALCDLHQAKYDLVLAAWQVFTVQHDVSDLLDTLMRVVRDLEFDRDGEVIFAATKQRQQQPHEDDDDEDDEDYSDDQADAQSDEGSEGDDEGGEEDGQSEHRSSLRAQAMGAVEDAKRDLLKHTLQIMVKQSLISHLNATALYQRALEGDVLIDTAIKAYAKDRNVVEFLDALQILANHTSEEIESMIHSTRAEQQQQQQQQQERDDDDDEEDEDEDDNSDGTSETSSTVDNTNSNSNTRKASASTTASSNFDNRQMYLRDLITELYEHEFVDKDTAVTLLYLNSVKDPKITEVLEDYIKVNDADKLIQTLVRLGNVEKIRIQRILKERDDAAAAGRSAISGDDDDDDDDADDDDSTSGYEDDSEDEEDASDDSADNHRGAQPSSTKARTSSPARSSAASDAIEGEKDDAIERKFLNIVQTMQLTSIETAALRLAIARGDVHVRNALEMFKSNQNEEDLAHTLRRIARFTIAQTIAEQEKKDAAKDGDDDDNDDDEEDEEEDDDDEEDDDEQCYNSSNGSKFRNSSH